VQGLLLQVQWWQLYQAHPKVACLRVLLDAHQPHQTLLLLLLQGWVLRLPSCQRLLLLLLLLVAQV
jgi:hypothetical protein